MPLYDEQDEVPSTRLHFRKLIAVNPNYFGNLPSSDLEPIEVIKNNTSYEALTCIGLNQASSQLEATIAIKLPVGFGGTLCTQGTLEYVRFYLGDGLAGSTFTDLGYAAAPVHNIPNANDCSKQIEKPLYYTITLPFTTAQSICVFPNLPVVRGILSWNVIPPQNDPTWQPVWGQVVDQNIQITPRLWKIIDILNLLPKDVVSKLPPQFAENPEIPFPLPTAAPLELGSLATLYKDSVPPHRFGFLSLQNLFSASMSQQEMLAPQKIWSGLKLDFAGAVKSLAETSGSTSYEQLCSLGLDYGRETLVASFRIKQTSGYSGSLCTAGSDEYVTFWTDWDNTCEWSYLGTVAVSVHDISNLPTDGLSFSAALPVDLSAAARSCELPKVAKVRAVLSWATPPSTTDANAVPVWGNIVDAHVQIPPGSPLTDFTITSIGGIRTQEIDTANTGVTLASAYFVYAQTPADARGCPFAGNIVITGGAPPASQFSQYRLWTQLPGVIAPSWVASPIEVFASGQTQPTPVIPTATGGWLPFLTSTQNTFMILSNWQPPVAGLWQIAFEVQNSAGVASGQPTAWSNILIKTSSPFCSIDLTSSSNCGDIPVGAKITGDYTVTDPYLNFYSFDLEPGALSIDIQPVPSSTDTKLSITNGAWILDTTKAGLKPCGYVVSVSAWDRTIQNSAPGPGKQGFADQGFCLIAAGSSNVKEMAGWDRCEIVE
ncbi:hypothetical protein MMC11_003594 [Xylographa trunciseda]|nr:hypothetical protein [Xylographa trunciseda]